MSSSPGAGYKLRPNKAVDRELFLSLLTRLSAHLNIENYHYIGLGGAFLEDFKLVHSRTGITRMTSVDSDEQTHLRQIFNKPIESLECVHSTLEEHLESTEFGQSVILWMDFTDPRQIQAQLELFSSQISELNEKSVIRITLNANPSSLGTPEASIYGEGVQEWRLEKLKERLPDHCPTDLTSEDLTQKNYGKTLLRILDLTAASAVLNIPGREIVWCLSTQYSDGQFMVTSTGIVTSNKEEIENLITNWEYRSTPGEPHILDMPALSTLERLTFESSENPKSKINFELPKSVMNLDPVDTFKKFNRVFPHFSRIEI